VRWCEGVDSTHIGGTGAEREMKHEWDDGDESNVRHVVKDEREVITSGVQFTSSRSSKVRAIEVIQLVQRAGQGH